MVKIRNSFVSNSSSSSFIITNKTDHALTLLDFVKEFGEELIEKWNAYYGSDDTYGDLVKDAKVRDSEGRTSHDEQWNVIEHEAYFEPGSQEVLFGDEDGDVLGRVFDYILRDGVDSDSFSVRFNKHCR